MSADRDIVYRSVVGVLRHIALQARPRLDPHGIIFNERYLHHEFSHRYQTLFPASNQLTSDIAQKGPDDAESALHPEWPTRKEVKVESRIDGGKYSDHEPVKTSEAGTAGHIDFAVGPYRQPWLAIEFKLTLGWSGKAVGFDLVKLLDSRNMFTGAISFNFILRDRLSQSFEGLHARILATHADAVQRLRGEHWARSRGPLLWYLVAEIAPTGRRFFQQTGAPKDAGKLRVAEFRGGATPAWEDLKWRPARP